MVSVRVAGEAEMRQAAETSAATAATSSTTSAGSRPRSSRAGGARSRTCRASCAADGSDRAGPTSRRPLGRNERCRCREDRCSRPLRMAQPPSPRHVFARAASARPRDVSHADPRTARAGRGSSLAEPGRRRGASADVTRCHADLPRDVRARRSLAARSGGRSPSAASNQLRAAALGESGCRQRLADVRATANGRRLRRAASASGDVARSGDRAR